MAAAEANREELLAEIDSLRKRLKDAEQAARAACEDPGRPRGGGAEHGPDTRLSGAKSLFHVMLNAPLDTISILTPDRRILHINEAGARRLGSTPEELAGRLVDDFFSHQIAASRKQWIDHVVRTGEPVFFDDARGKIILSNRLYPVFDENRRVEAVVVLATEITQRKREHDAMLREKERAETYLELADVMLIALDKEQRVTLINRKGCEILGGSKEKILGENWFDRFLPPDRREEVKTVYEQIMSGNLEPVLRYENPIIRLDGEERIIAWRNTLLRDAAGSIIGTLGSGEDITEKLEAERALRESEKRFRTLFEESTLAILIEHPDGRIEAANPAASALFGYDPGEWNGVHAADLSDEAGRAFITELIARGGAPKPFTIEMTGRRKDGSLFPMEVHSFNAEFTDETILFIFVQSIVERKKNEEAIRRSEKLLDDTGRIAKIGGWEHDLVTREAVWTRSLYDIIEIDPAERPPGPDEHLKYYPREQRKILAEAYERAVRDGVPVDLELLVHTAKGKPIWCRVFGEPVFHEGRCVKMRGVFQDITEKKAAEDALRRSEEKFRTITKRSTVGVYVVREGKLVYVNPSLAASFGYRPEEMTAGLGVADVIHPDDLDFAAREIRLRMGGKAERGNVILKGVRKDGSIIDLDISGTPIEYEGGAALMGTVVDITERLAAERALSESERRFRTVFENAADAMIIRDLETGAVLAPNDEAVRRYGYARRELRDMALVGLDAEENAPFTPEQLVELEEKGRVFFETVFRHRDGTPIPTEVNAQVIEYGGKKRLFAVHRDISERKRAEREIEDRRAELEEILRAIPEALVYADIERRIRRVNPAFEHIFGFRPEEVIGQKTEILYSEKGDFGKQGDKRYNVDAGKMYEPYEIDHKRKSGEVFPAEVVGTPVRNASGEAVGFLGLVRDITERKRAEETIRNALEEIRSLKEMVEAENIILREEIKQAHLQGEIIGQSEGIRSVLVQAEQVAPTDSTVLILGETGTGKELLARAIHSMSPRRDRPMVIVNCAAIPDSLVESELFGHEKGAFTGAVAGRVGRLEVADGSTLFLDEVGDLPAETQAKLLRVLQEGRFEKVGSDKTIRVDVRVIAATHHDLEKNVKSGSFREDLFYRLNVFPIVVPPLRERREDIETLVWAFVGEFGEKMGKRIESISRKNLDTLRNHSWPGNIRELRNIIERAVILARGKTLHVDIPEQPRTKEMGAFTLADREKEHIIEALELSNWRVRGKGGAADSLGLKPTTLEARMKKLGIRRPEKE
ncbi:MAG: PAS domain S-box protein [Candidatus Eisenbacteria bacterium]|nr:PAS domain S-box protein [Candidatus Eisenbacteria bacterium]